MKGAGEGMLRKNWKGLVLCGLVGFWIVFGAHAGRCWVTWVPCLQGG